MGYNFTRKREKIVLLNDGRIFESVKDVVEKLGVPQPSVSNVINHRRGYVKGLNGERFVFVRESEYNNLSEEEIKAILFKNQSSGGRKIVALNTGKCYNSIMNASKSTGVSYTSIYHCLLGNIRRTISPSGETIVWRDKVTYDSLTEDDIKRILYEASKRSKENPVVLLNTGEEFSSVKEASRATGIGSSNISHCLAGTIRRTYTKKGEPLVWVYKHDFKSLNNEEIYERIYGKGYKTKYREIILTNTGEEFHSIKQASIELNISYIRIFNCLSGITSHVSAEDGEHLVFIYKDY